MASPDRDRLGAIDTMRGVAILLVIIYHAGPLALRMPSWDEGGWLVWPDLGFAWLAVPLLHFGFTGVHAFFIVSGFCIHLRAARARAAGEPFMPPLGAFWLRRFVRIYPPYWIALLLFGLALPLGARLVGATPPPAIASPADLGLHALMLHTLSTRTFFSINPAFWSLATEEQFYLAYPLALRAIARFGIARVVIAALGLSLLWRIALLAALPPSGENFLLYRVLLHGLFAPRWFEWLLGCLLAEAVARRRIGAARTRTWVAAALIFLCAGATTRLHIALDKLLADALFGLGFTALMAALLGHGAARSASGALAQRLLQATGRRAYGIYLMHQPILDAAALMLAIRLPLALAAGWIYSRLCERPFERWAQAVPLVARATPSAAAAPPSIADG